MRNAADADVDLVTAVDRATLLSRLAAATTRAYPGQPATDCYAAVKLLVDRGDAFLDTSGAIVFTTAGRNALPRIAPPSTAALDQTDAARTARALSQERALLGILPTDDTTDTTDPRITRAVATEGRILDAQKAGAL